jgi:uncharacterized membrane protein YhaH (DUF805 family)
MSTVLDHYFSFHGRLARLPFFIRGIYLVIAAVVLFFVSVALFANGGRLWWWLGLIEVIVCLSVLGVGSVSLIVRRLHDLGFSGYHVIWVGAAELGSARGAGSDFREAVEIGPQDIPLQDKIGKLSFADDLDQACDLEFLEVVGEGSRTDLLPFVQRAARGRGV